MRTPLPRSMARKAGCVVAELQLPMIWAGYRHRAWDAMRVGRLLPEISRG